MYIFLKFSNCRIIITQTTYFENIQYCKIYFYYCLGLTKTKYNDSASYFWKIFPFQISIFLKFVDFFQNSNCRIIIAQTIYFVNIQYCEIYFHYGLGLTKTSYNDSASFFWKIFPISNLDFFQKCQFY